VSVAFDTSTARRPASFTRYAWSVLGWNLLVILWGAYVRASGSGAGCGSHWPLCNGEVIPNSPGIQTAIEFTHRAMSGLAIFAMAGLAWWSFRDFPRGHRVRRAAVLSLIFFAVEALLGAGLVLLHLVGDNASIGRAVYLALHLVNTQLLLATLVMAAWFSRDTGRHDVHPASAPSGLAIAALPLTILVSVTGVIAALGDTLFPARSLAEGFRQDLSSTASFLIRLRSLHPFVAIIVAAYCAWVAISVARKQSSSVAGRIALVVLVLSLAQLCAGAINLAMLAPIPMQIFHLLLADALWIALVLLAIEYKEKLPA